MQQNIATASHVWQIVSILHILQYSSNLISDFFLYAVSTNNLTLEDFNYAFTTLNLTSVIFHEHNPLLPTLSYYFYHFLTLLIIACCANGICCCCCCCCYFCLWHTCYISLEKQIISSLHCVPLNNFFASLTLSFLQSIQCSFCHIIEYSFLKL